MKFGSEILNEVVEQLATLPGVGRRSAVRMALHLATRSTEKVNLMASALVKMASSLKTCKQCHAFADSDLCDICGNPNRDRGVICVVESIRDIIAIEETGQFHGYYHILGGLISPLDGIGPSDLKISQLIDRIQSTKPAELIMAIRPSIEGETTIYYIGRHLPSDQSIKVSLIARGISFGSELEFADEMTLSRSILSRTPYLIQDNALA
ncbi:MAG: recombination protein RecR [Saprospiraceae bacterium]|jgi:recombination protein RecR|nr:recombination protein RecR [Saprospiraceae bacterium]MBK7795015.1 recombination protein RecR [Saprospiraceae bacterium]MBK8153483.1 recombination protein RecR [Saprospiraceae bacterium]MBK9376887.1 recombination protein RecR [Saprospiraceae bacterium]MBL0262097.1 recombination protein RecR [Saprospiraceae bacterium]